MAGRVGVDFGTSNTVVAVWDDAAGHARPLWIPDYGHLFQQGDDTVPVVPSLVHYASDGRRLIGDQVLSGGLYDARGTFRWMKRYVAHRNPTRVDVNGKRVSHADAGADFLAAVLTFAAVEAGAEGDEVTLTVPVEAYEDYEDWLVRAAESVGMSRLRLVDEPSAAALGYGAHIQPGQVYLLFDFGGGTVQAAVVRVLDEDERLATGRPCRVLGKSGDDVGGSTIDHWIFAELLARNGCHDSDDDVREISRALLVECERGKEALTGHDRVDVSVMHPRTGRVLEVELVRSGPDGGRTVSFEELLDRNDLFSRIDRVVRRALRAAADRGYDEDDVTAVLMVGGSSLVPAVQRTLQRRGTPACR
jgi:molecular chaperone DnaK